MNGRDRTMELYRTAAWLHQLYQQRRREQILARLDPVNAMLVPHVEELRKLEQFMARAARLGLMQCQCRLRARYERSLQGLQERVSQMQQRWAEPVLHAPALRQLYEELNAVEEEFGAVEVDPRSKGIAAQTESIVLEGVALGAFRIVLEAGRMTGTSPDGWYHVQALQPNPAGTNDEIVHPHVDGDHLCAGDATVPIDRALRQGRLCDFFLLVRSVLETYNPHSAYVELENWDGIACHDCGYTACSDSSCYCEGCDYEYCEECILLCESCQLMRCRGCMVQSAISESYVCEPCSARCSACARRCMRDELEDELCPLCLEQAENQQENGHDDDQEAQEQHHQPAAEADAPAAPVLATDARAHPLVPGVAQASVSLPRR